MTSQPDQPSASPDDVKDAVGIPDELAEVKVADLTAAALDKVDDGAAEHDGVAAAATALAPAVAKEGGDPEGEKAEPDCRACHKVVEAVLARVDISDIVAGVVSVLGAEVGRQRAGPVIVDSNPKFVPIEHIEGNSDEQ